MNVIIKLPQNIFLWIDSRKLVFRQQFVFMVNNKKTKLKLIKSLNDCQTILFNIQNFIKLSKKKK